MRVLSLFSLFLPLLLPLQTQAGTLTIPMNFEYLAINGNAIQTSSFRHKADLELAPGQHKIAIRFHELVDDEFSDSQSFVSSSPLLISFHAKHDDYQLQPIGTLAMQDPHTYAELPQLQIVNAQGQIVPIQVEYTEDKGISLLGKLFGQGEVSERQQFAMAATATPSIQTTEATQALMEQDKVLQEAIAASGYNAKLTVESLPTEEKQAEEMLQYWWLQADEATRKEFISWAIRQL